MDACLGCEVDFITILTRRSFQVPEGDRPVTPGQLGPDHPTHSSASSPMKNRDKGKARDDSGTPVQDPAGEGDGSGLAAGKSHSYLHISLREHPLPYSKYTADNRVNT